MHPFAISLPAFPALLLLAAASLPGCGGDGHTEEDPDLEACEHLTQAEGAVALTAASTASPTAPALGADHRRYDVTLVDVAGAAGKAGYLTFAASAVGDYLFFSSAPVQLVVTGPTGGEVAAESSAGSSAACPEVKGRHVYPLQVGTHVLGVTAADPAVSFVVEGGAH